MFRIAPRCEIAAQPHGDRSGRHLSEPRGDDDARGVDGSGESGRQGEWNGKTVGHSDDDIANHLGAGEMVFDVGCLRQRSFYLGDAAHRR
jgi:hypothetical protein